MSGVRKPRCATHTRAHKRAGKARARDTYVQRTYGITPDQYRAMLEWQGGKCYICRRATGATKALAVDHDHACCPGPTSCGQCWRGILCGPCNRDVIGRLDSEALRRAAAYLECPPARLWRAGIPASNLLTMHGVSGILSA